MSQQSLANKYRSKDFDDLVGQDHIAVILKHQAIHHTRQANYLFVGPRGTGKTSSARLFAKALNCLHIQENGGNPDNTCENCVAIDAGTTLDILEIDAASHTGIDKIREEIIDKLAYRPTLLKKRVTIIDEVHMLSRGAFNALLKTMEEPSEWMVFILATTEFHKVPETIISRCQVFNFRKIAAELIAHRLSYIATQENITTTPAGLAMIADLSDGIMRDAVKYLDQISVMGEVNETNVAQFLGVVSELRIQELVQQYEVLLYDYNPQNLLEIVTTIENFAQQGIDLTVFPIQLMAYADRHFSNNAQLYSSLSDFCATILRQLKWYPHPLLLYKTLLAQLSHNTGFEQGTTPSLQDQKNESSKVEKLTGGIPQPTPATNGSTQHKNTLDTKKSNQDQSSQSTHSEQENKQDQTVTQDTSDNLTSNDYSTLRASVLDQLPQSLQNLLRDQSELKSLGSTSVSLIITNIMAKTVFKKAENYDLLRQLFSTISTSPIQDIELIYMSKEDYFQQYMG